MLAVNIIFMAYLLVERGNFLGIGWRKFDKITPLQAVSCGLFFWLMLVDLISYWEPVKWLKCEIVNEIVSTKMFFSIKYFSFLNGLAVNDLMNGNLKWLSCGRMSVNGLYSTFLPHVYFDCKWIQTFLFLQNAQFLSNSKENKDWILCDYDTNQPNNSNITQPLLQVSHSLSHKNKPTHNFSALTEIFSRTQIVMLFSPSLRQEAGLINFN